MQRLAKRLDGWYQAGLLRSGQARGFHLDADFPYYCAWFCPAEKGLFDRRLTAPPAVASDYLALRQSMLALAGPVDPKRPARPPDPLLRQFGITHAVLNGANVLNPPPFLDGLGLALFSAPDRWTPWAIEGLGVICGWNDAPRRGAEPFAALRLDPLRYAVGDRAEKAPPPPAEFPRPTPPTTLDRYVSAPAPLPPDSSEAGLWLAYRTTCGQRGDVAVNVARLAAHLGRLNPDGLPDLVNPWLNNWPRDPNAARLSAGWQAAWQRSLDGRAGRAASLLAIRAARRAIAANPVHADGFARLAQAYVGLESDPALHLYQQLAAIRQTLARVEVTQRRPSPLEEHAMLDQLVQLYERHYIPGTRINPADLFLEALKRDVEVREQIMHMMGGPTALKQQAADIQRRQHGVEQMRKRVQELRDDYENRAYGQGNQQITPLIRAVIAVERGLIREALAVLQAIEPNNRDIGSVQLQASLLLFAGEPDEARSLLDQVPIDQIMPGAQLQFRLLSVQAAAAVGDYPGAIEHASALMTLLPGQPDVGRAAADVVAHLLLPDASPGHPLARVLTLPRWGGVWGPDGQPAALNGRQLPIDWLQLNSSVQGLQDYGDWVVRQGVVALEGGDAALARQRFTEAVGPSAPPLVFKNRALARSWLELWATEQEVNR
jgi:hypothetical protein